MPFRRSLFTEKALLVSKAQFIGVIFRVKPTIMTELCERKTFVKNKNKNENNSQFCHFWFDTLPMSQRSIKGSASFAIRECP